MRLVTARTPLRYARTFAGGKGTSLHRLAAAGLEVPPWAVVGRDAYRRYLGQNRLSERLAALTANFELGRAGAVAAEAGRLLQEGAIDDDLRNLIRAAYEHVGGGSVAVRSSATEEDGRALSYAGQFETSLNVTGLDAVVSKVKSCWASAYSERVLIYRHHHRVHQPSPEMAVVIQRMVPAEKSGVAFSRDPTGVRNARVICSAFGLGEGIVSGAVDADCVYVDRANGSIVHTVVGEKDTAYRPAVGAAGCVTSPVPESDRVLLSLTSDEIGRLVREVERVEALFGSEQDVEWALHGDVFSILQARPLTGLSAVQNGRLRIWDNSNIIESYGGVVSPLTFTFASNAYYRVHRRYAEVLGVPAAELEELDGILRTMLGYFHGRVYYNLLNWYRVLRLLPFYRAHRTAFEIAIGASEKLSDELAEQMLPFAPASPFRALRIRATIALRFGYLFFTMQAQVERFLDYFYARYEAFDAIDYDALSAEEAYEHLEALGRDLIAEWGRMLVLDASISVAYGVLHALTKRWLGEVPEWFLPAVTRPVGAVESMGPARELCRLAALVRGDDTLTRLLTETPPERVYDEFVAAGAEELLDGIDQYMKEFGYRGPNELKLEEPDLREVPTPFYRNLRSAVMAAERPPGDDERQHEARERGGEYLQHRLSGLRRYVYRRVSGKVSSCLEARERVRFCRTRAFGVARKIVRAIGTKLAESGTIETATDVFYFRLDELRGYFEATVSHGEIRPVIEQRKNDETGYRAIVREPARFETKGDAYSSMNLERAGWGRSTEPNGSPRQDTGPVLLGTPCGAGHAEAEVTVLTSPLDVAGGILATYRTDPGWTSVLPSATGLLIERGSPLTHVALVARELGIPTIVQIKDLTLRVRSGMRLRMDGASGRIEILEEGRRREEDAQSSGGAC